MEDNVISQQDNEQSPPQTPKKKKSKWRWLFYIILLLLLAIIGTVGFLATGKGQRLALNWIINSFDELTFQKVEGSLQEGLTISDAHFQMDGVDVQAKQAEVQIGFRCLLDKAACVENLALRDAKVVIDTSKLPPSQPKQETPIGEIVLPLPVSLKKLEIDNLQLQLDEMDLSLNHFHSAISGEGKNILLEPTLLQGLTLSLPPQRVKNSEKVAKTAEPVDWDTLKKQLAEPLLTKLDPIKLPMNFAIPEFKAKDIHILQKQQDESGNVLEPTSLVKISDVNLIGKSDEQSIELQTLSVQTDKGNVAGQGVLTLADNYPLDWQLQADSPDLPEFKLPASQVDLKLAGELFGKTELDVQTKGAVNAQIQGVVQLAEPKTPLNLTLKSDEIRYPFIAEKGVEPLKLQGMDIALNGNLLNYGLDGKVAMSGMNLPTGSLAVQGKGELTQFELEKLAINALQGTADLSGKVDWQNGVEWDANANLNNVHTKSLLPDWAAVLSGNLHSKGYAGRGKNADEWAVSVSEMDIKGNLFQKNLQLKGELTADHQTLLNVPNASLIYGENVIGLNGVLGEKSDFSAEIKAPNLQGLVPNLNASINGNVRLLGKVTEPELDLDLVANNVSYDQIKLQHLTAKGKISSEKEIAGNLDVALRQFGYNEIKVEQANLTASGSESQHSLNFTGKGEPVGANLQLTGKFDRAKQLWQGQLSQIAIQGIKPIGEWKADKPIQVSYNNQQIRADISAHCWHNPKANLCFPQAFQAGKEGKIPFEIKQLDLNVVQEYLDKNSQLSGVLNAKGDAAWFTNKSPEVNVEVHSDSVKFVQKIDYRNFPLTLTPVKLKANFVDNNLKLNTDIRIENNGRLVSELVMKDVAKNRNLSGNINIEQLNLNLIKPILESGDSVNGEINARLTVGGSALSPLLYGNLNLTGLKARSTAMPMDIVGGNLALNFNGASSTLKGNVQTKESNLLLEGDANWQKLDAWHTRISAKADRFRVDIPSIAKVDVSPNIQVKATPKELFLTGNVDIPWARIAVEELPESAVSVSGDEVIMDGSAKNKLSQKLLPKNLPPKQTQSGMAINADISVNIGDRNKGDVKLDAYGFKTDLYGTLKVRQGNKGLGLYGQVNLKNGKFASFGQDLIVRKGVISFTGLPSQPTLDVEAIRNPEAMEDPSVTAGVKVTGIADSPDVKVFSSPSMPQDQALSYILTGRSLENSGDAGSSNSIAAALIGLSLSKSSKMVGGVGSAFGITDLNVSTAGIGDNTKVVVSGSLTPKFKVKYGVGIFAPLTELTLRYRLAPSLYLQWISSVNQAVDLMYRFEFD